MQEQSTDALLRELAHARSEVEALRAEAASARKNATQARERSARSAAALDDLAYAISHDLRAPLRAITTFSSWLERDLDKSLNGETREYMRLLRSRTAHLESLIDGMLQYSRAGSGAIEPESVDTKALIESVAAEISATGAITIESDMPVLETDREALHRVLYNLLHNAVVYSDDAPRVRVRARRAGHQYEFAVADDGPGIPERLHSRIWMLFQSAQPPGTEGSTGVGLAIARKLVEREGGRIWVESEPGHGATFRFLWPAVMSC